MSGDYIAPWLAIPLGLVLTLVWLRIRAVQRRSPDTEQGA